MLNGSVTCYLKEAGLPPDYIEASENTDESSLARRLVNLFRMLKAALRSA